MDIISITLGRHSIKTFDSNKKLTAEQAEELRTLLQFSPSGTNSQPWYFTVASTDGGKARVAKSATSSLVFSGHKMLDASHVVVFCTKTVMDDMWLGHMVDQEESDDHFVTPETEAANHKNRTFFIDIHRKELKDDNHWTAGQVYPNVGNLLLGVTATNLDVMPIEGFGSAAMDAESGLKEKGFISVVVVSVGHHSIGDFNTALPKSRLPLETTLTEVQSSAFA